MKKDIILTSFVQMLAILSLIVCFKLVSTLFGEDSFLLYSITRRNISLTVLILNFGVSLSLIKFISSCSESKKEKVQYFISALYILIIAYILAGIAIFLFTKQLSYLLYADYEHKTNILASYIGVGGLLANSIVYAFFRGEINTNSANLIDTLNHAIIPIISLFIANSIDYAFFITGGGQIFFSSISVIYIIKKYSTSGFSLPYSTALKKGRELFRLGITKVPAEAGMMAFFMLSTTFMTHLYGIKLSGYFSFALTLVTTTSYVFLPIGIVLLPRLSKLQANKCHDNINKIVKKTLFLVIALSLCITVFFYYFINDLLNLFLQEVSSYKINITLLTILSLTGYSTYSVSKSIIDALNNKGLNSYNVSFMLLLFMIGYAVLVNILSDFTIIDYLFLFNACALLLGTISILIIYKILPK